jgi:phospholipid/cholesterol/gamma-HCH transport system substrate-binding protein
MVALFAVWLSRWGAVENKKYDIFFKSSVDGLAKGSQVAFSGVPIGVVDEIALYRPDPGLVRVRISVNPDTPILEGTTATIQGSFTGTSTVQLDGAVKGAPPIVCPEQNTAAACPFGVPMIPAKAGGLGALLNSAPRLLERISTLTERLTELLSDRNQQSLEGILANTERLSKALADRGPEIAATLAETRITLQRAGRAAEQIGNLAQTTDGVLANDIKPTVANLNRAIGSAQKSMESLDALVTDARPAVQGVSKQTLPEINQLVRDLRIVTSNAASLTERLEQGGASSLVGSRRLPDYEPNK